MTIKNAILTFLENNLFLKNGTCPICGKVLFVTDSFLCHHCRDDLNKISQPTCKRCGRPVFHDDSRVCDLCAKYNLPFAGGYAHFPYDAVSRRLVHAIKFKDRPHLGIWVGNEMGAALAREAWIREIDIIVPVPLHPHRLAERGYNQSEKIARGIREGFNQTLLTDNSLTLKKVALSTEVLRRTRDTPHQIGQGRDERLRNLSGAFDIEGIESIQNKTILLVDDVLTTGATLAETSATLLEAGVRKVYIATVCAVAE
jgi:predicted amidophosphoribosyltransferase